jgi:hypothetical protein
MPHARAYNVRSGAIAFLSADLKSAIFAVVVISLCGRYMPWRSGPMLRNEWLDVGQDRQVRE